MGVADHRDFGLNSLWSIVANQKRLGQVHPVYFSNEKPERGNMGTREEGDIMVWETG